MKEFSIYGRLGNQLFQFANIYTEIFYGEDKDYALYFGEEIPKFDFSSLEYPPKFSSEDGGNFDGWKESEIFFDKELIRKIYLSPTEKACKYFANKYGDLENTLFISVRRGDFIELKDMFLCCNAKYYETVYNLITKEHKYDKVFLTSDNIEWCKENIHLDCDITFLEEYDPMEILYLASCCKDFIINTSTFAWWCAWFGEKNGGKIICPNRKFLTDDLEIENNIFFPDRWIKVYDMEGLYEK